MHRARAGRWARRAFELGQDALGCEPLCIARMMDEHRRLRRRTEYAHLGDGLADDRVDESRLASAGRAADDGEQRRVELHEPRQDVVLELVDGIRASLTHRDGVIGLEIERRRADGFPQPYQGREQLRRRSHRYLAPHTPPPSRPLRVFGARHSYVHCSRDRPGGPTSGHNTRHNGHTRYPIRGRRAVVERSVRAVTVGQEDGTERGAAGTAER